MKFESRKERERLGASLFLALLFHLILFLILEYGGFMPQDEPADYIGPVFVELGEVTSIPQTGQIESEEVQPEEGSVESLVKPEEAVKPPEEQAESGQSESIEAEGEEAESRVLTSESAETEEALPESRIEKSTETYKPPPQTAPVDESLYEGKDEGRKFTVRMSDKSDKAQPNFKIPVTLPRWVEQQGKRLTITFSFIVGTDGYITHLKVDESSGYTDLDSAIRRAVLKWKFSNPLVKERIMGTFTYRINQ